jgi:hypothetical protein
MLFSMKGKSQNGVKTFARTVKQINICYLILIKVSKKGSKLQLVPALWQHRDIVLTELT